MTTARQAKFIDHFLESGNASEAARLAGYASRSAKVTACRLLNHPEVVATVRTRRCEIEAGYQLSREKVVNGLLSAISMAELKGDAGTVISGWRELGKLLGYYEPERKKIDVSLDARRVISRFEQMSDAELVTWVENAPADVV